MTKVVLPCSCLSDLIVIYKYSQLFSYIYHYSSLSDLLMTLKLLMYGYHIDYHFDDKLMNNITCTCIEDIVLCINHFNFTTYY